MGLIHLFIGKINKQSLQDCTQWFTWELVFVFEGREEAFVVDNARKCARLLNVWISVLFCQLECVG